MQLETIYVLEGLGPPKEHVQKSKSFKDQVTRVPNMVCSTQSQPEKQQSAATSCISEQHDARSSQPPARVCMPGTESGADLDGAHIGNVYCCAMLILL